MYTQKVIDKSHVKLFIYFFIKWNIYSCFLIIAQRNYSFVNRDNVANCRIILISIWLIIRKCMLSVSLPSFIRSKEQRVECELLLGHKKILLPLLNIFFWGLISVLNTIHNPLTFCVGNSSNHAIRIYNVIKFNNFFWHVF